MVDRSGVGKRHDSNRRVLLNLALGSRLGLKAIGWLEESGARLLSASELISSWVRFSVDLLSLS